MGSRGILIVVIGVGLAATVGCGARTELDVPDAHDAAPDKSDADASRSDGGVEAAVDAGRPTSLALGGGFACALRSGGTVACWGINEVGELGNGTSKGPQNCDYVPYACSATPVDVLGLGGVTAIAAGNANGCALLSGGAVECWGENTFGELGDGTSNGPQDCSGYPCSTTPVAVSGLSGVTAIAGGADAPGLSGFACALLSGGTVECWGINYDGELGDGTMLGPETCDNPLPCSTTPVAVSGLSGVTAIAAGERFACALLSGGTVQCWGSSFYGQLGNGTSTGSTTPVAVSDVSGVTAIAAGGAFACALLSGGTVACWGDNEWGQLGNGSSSGPETCSPSTVPCSTTPMAVSGLSGVTAIAVGGAHTCALLSGGTVMCWGANFFGQLGNGSSSGPETCPPGANGMGCSTTPVAVPGLSGVRAIASGASESCAVLTGGTVECWGDNAFGELGNGTSTGPQKCMYGNQPSACSPTPVTVSGL